MNSVIARRVGPNMWRTLVASAVACLLIVRPARAQEPPAPAEPAAPPASADGEPQPTPEGGDATESTSAPGSEAQASSDDPAPASPPHPKDAPQTESTTSSETSTPPGTVEREGHAPPRLASARPRPTLPPASRQDTAPLTYTLESVQVRGNERTRRSIVLRYIPFKPGTLLDPKDPEIELARYRLLGTGFFRKVEFSLVKGSRRGHVRLVVDVEERNTIVVNDVWMGLAADAETSGKPRPLTAYAGFDVAETNLAGTGITLGAGFGFSENQSALRARYLDPAFLGTPWMLSGSLLYNDATDFFGNADVEWVADYVPQYNRFAVVRYKRFGGVVGLGRDLDPSTQLWGHYRLETADAQLPAASRHVRGGVDEPILYDILPGHSILATLRATLQHDTRDHPFLPTQGWFTTVTAETGIPGGCDYEFQRFDVLSRWWWKLPWYQHVAGLNAFVGVIGGDAPFFEQYYIGDFSDFLPSRMLGLRFDRRPPPDFLDTAIREVRYGHYAFQLSGEYRIPLYRGSRAVYGIDIFSSFGIWGLAHRRDLSDPPRSYSGASLIPVDLTGNIGFRMDTSAGGLVFAFSNVLGFIPFRGDEGL